MLTPAIPCPVSGYTAVNVDTATSKPSMGGRMKMLHSKRRSERPNSVGIYFFHNEGQLTHLTSSTFRPSQCFNFRTRFQTLCLLLNNAYQMHSADMNMISESFISYFHFTQNKHDFIFTFSPEFSVSCHLMFTLLT